MDLQSVDLSIQNPVDRIAAELAALELRVPIPSRELRAIRAAVKRAQKMAAINGKALELMMGEIDSCHEMLMVEPGEGEPIEIDRGEDDE